MGFTLSVISAAVSVVGAIQQKKAAEAQGAMQAANSRYQAQVAANNYRYQAQVSEYNAQLNRNQAALEGVRTTSAKASAKKTANDSLDNLIRSMASAAASSAARNVEGLAVERDILGKGVMDYVYGVENESMAALNGNYQMALYLSQAELRDNEARYNLQLADSAIVQGNYAAGAAIASGQMAGTTALIGGFASAVGSVATGASQHYQIHGSYPSLG